MNLKAQVAQYNEKFRVMLQVWDDERLITERPFELCKEVFEAETQYRAWLACEAVSKALNAAMNEYKMTDDVEYAAFVFDSEVMFQPVFNYPVSHIVYA